ncbi:MAG: response regulator [Pseudomonadales bacterium]
MEHALIVDDSRTARAVLKHMLGKESYTVVAVESAEQALEYLLTQTTDVIFMDHMMPGMDGFSAVKRLKDEDKTAHIPIVMYTSKEGEVYSGQAHALGAAAILSKPATQEQLQSVLLELNEIAKTSAVMEVAKNEAAVAVGVELVSDTTDSAVQIAAAEQTQKTEPAAVAQQRVQKASEPALPVDTEPAAIQIPRQKQAANTSAGSSNLWTWIAGIATLLVALLGARNAILSDKLEAMEANEAKLLDHLLQASNLAAQFPNGEIPFAGTRIETSRQLLEGAELAGFKGIITARAYVGQFCMQQAATGELFVASDGLAIGDCDAIGQNGEAALRQSRQKSAAFKEFISTHPALVEGGIEFRTEGMGSVANRQEYPAVKDVATAGDWNSVARKNNRVEFVLDASAQAVK